MKVAAARVPLPSNDNLYLSKRYFDALGVEGWQAAGVTRKSGFPPDIIQAEVTRKAAKEAAKGTLLARRTADGKMVAASYYDSKPVNMLSSIHWRVEMMEKERTIYVEGKPVTVTYMRLNIIDEYNNYMGGVDLFDQLRTYYRPDGRLRFRKWWHPIYVQSISFACTQAYICHKILCKRASEKPLSHIDFLLQIAEDLVNYVGPSSKGKRKRNSTDGAGAGAGPVTPVARYSPAGVPQMSFSPPGKDYSPKDAKIRRGDPHSLPGVRLNRSVPHPCVSSFAGKKCGYHLFLQPPGTARNLTNAKLYCMQCKTNLCIDCWNDFHGLYT